MKKITLLLLLITSFTFAQTNFIPGTITKQDGTVLNGFINYQDWKIIPEEIEFKVGQTIQMFAPNEIKAFEVKNDKFISRDVTLDVTEQKLQRLTKRHDPAFEDKRIFLNVLEAGEVSLYEYYDSRPHYFAEKGSDFIELTNRILLDEKTGDIRKNRKYLGQLSVFLQDCPSISVNENLNYKRKELLRLITKYNNCVSVSDDEDKYTKDVNGKTTGFFVTGGFGASSFSVDSPQTSLKEFEGSQAVSPNLGLAFDFLFSKNRQKWSLYTELLYTSFKSTETTDEEAVFRSYNPLSMDYKTLDLSLLFRHKFSKDNQKITPFLNLGIGRSLIISQNNTVTENDLFDPSRTKDIPVKINSSFNFLFGGGIIYKKMSAEIRYSIGDKLTNILTEFMKVSSLKLLVSYKLN